MFSYWNILLISSLGCVFSLVHPLNPNILLIITDDQDVYLDGMFPMKHVQQLIGTQGVTFSNAFTTSPLCCPSRASLLSGLYAHNHLTKNNSFNGGCNDYHWQSEIEPNALPVLLQRPFNKLLNGYETFFAGKYLNQYYGAKVPPGWNDFHGLHGNSRYYNYTLHENGQNISYTDVYLTDLLLNLTMKFIDNRPIKSSRPFFAMIAPPAPHAPFTPAERHHNHFAGVNALRTPNYNIVSTKSDKHWLLANSTKISEITLSKMDEYFQHRWESLLSVDELVAGIIHVLQNRDELSNTYIIFTSDNGYHIGQFAQPFDKRQPYETDIRIPLLIRGPKIPPATTLNAPVSLIDILPTILEWANLPSNNNLDGQSFQRFLMNSDTYDPLLDKEYHRSLLIQHWGEGNENTYSAECPYSINDNLSGCTIDAECHCQDSWNNTYACIRHFRYEINQLYCEFKDYENFVEAYNLNEDRFQLRNIVYEMLPIERAFYSLALTNLTRCSGVSCRNINI